MRFDSTENLYTNGLLIIKYYKKQRQGLQESLFDGDSKVQRFWNRTQNGGYQIQKITIFK